MVSQDEDQPVTARKISVFGREFTMPRSRRARIVIGVGLIVLGIFGFLPVLGFWMVPLGLAAVLLGRLEAASPARSGDLEHADGDAVGVAGARADEEAVHHPGQRR